MVGVVVQPFVTSFLLVNVYIGGWQDKPEYTKVLLSVKHYLY